MALVIRLGVERFGAFNTTIPAALDDATVSELDGVLMRVFRKKLSEWARRFGVARKPVRKFKRRR